MAHPSVPLTVSPIFPRALFLRLEEGERKVEGPLVDLMVGSRDDALYQRNLVLTFFLMPHP